MDKYLSEGDSSYEEGSSYYDEEDDEKESQEPPTVVETDVKETVDSVQL